jgi:hypothetical protein
MANVLGELFQDIADAIREKTGGSGTMKPMDFPLAIAGIETGGSGGVNKNVVVESGEFTAPSTPTIQTITHGLGCKPDVLILVMSDHGAGSIVDYSVLHITFIVQYSQALTDVYGGTLKGLLGTLRTPSQASGIGAADFSDQREMLHDYMGAFFVNNDTTFQVGTDNKTCILRPGATYRWYLIGGLT